MFNDKTLILELFITSFKDVLRQHQKHCVPFTSDISLHVVVNDSNNRLLIYRLIGLFLCDD